MHEIEYVTHKQTTTTELQAPDLGQAHTYIMWLFSNDKKNVDAPTPNY